jgi:hypothetical protein
MGTVVRARGRRPWRGVRSRYYGAGRLTRSVVATDERSVRGAGRRVVPRSLGKTAGLWGRCARFGLRGRGQGRPLVFARNSSG